MQDNGKIAVTVLVRHSMIPSNVWKTATFNSGMESFQRPTIITNVKTENVIQVPSTLTGAEQKKNDTGTGNDLIDKMVKWPNLCTASILLTKAFEVVSFSPFFQHEVSFRNDERRLSYMTSGDDGEANRAIESKAFGRDQRDLRFSGIGR